MKRPWMKFYPLDWRGDPRLRMCSLAARGLWIDLISYMHEGEPYGHLTIDGIAPDEAAIAALVGRPAAEVRKAIAELEQRKVFSRSDSGAIFSRRMIADAERSEEGRKQIAKRWPNRSDDRPPNRGATEEPITQRPDTRLQSPDRKKEESKGRASRAKARTPLDENWNPDDDGVAYAKEHGFIDSQIPSMALNFRDHHRAKGNLMADWPAAWRTWVRNEIKFQRNSNGGQRGSFREDRSVGRAAGELAEQGATFGPKPSLFPASTSADVVRLLPERRSG